MEAKRGICQLKDMDKGTQIEMPLDKVLDAVIAEVGTDALSFYHPSRDFIITEGVQVDEEKMKRLTQD
jgi:hypothetical protein